MNIQLISYYIGIFIVFFSHTYMLFFPKNPLTTPKQHIYLNITASFLIAYYFVNTEFYSKRTTVDKIKIDK